MAAATGLALGLPSFVATIPSARQGSSQFRAGVDLVAVDLLAVDDQGRPIADLRPANLQLKVDGRPRDIRQLEFIKVARTSVENSGAMPSLLAPFATNASDLMGRLVVLVVDEEHIRPGEGKPVLDAAARFVDRLAPTDRVALVTLPTDTIRVDATTNRERVRQSLLQLVGAPRRSRSEHRSGQAMAVDASRRTPSPRPRCRIANRFASSPHRLQYRRLEAPVAREGSLDPDHCGR
jgi:VWFA-related protein